MAGRDYILCKKCQTKIVYDGDDNGRERLESVWGDPNAADWTVFLLCPVCIAKYEHGVSMALDCIRKGKYTTAIKALSRI
jgi:hypothetical protein